MTRKEKKARKRLQSTRQLMGIDRFTDYGLKVGKSELVFFLIRAIGEKLFIEIL